MDKKKILYTFAGLVVLTSLLKLFAFYTPDDAASNQQAFNDKYYVFALNTPKNLTFCGEKVPVDQFDVRERLDRELLLNTYWQSQTMLYHKRASRWFPVISPILKRNGIPDDFKYLALAESGFVNTSSPAGAVGYWQFLESTAKSYGLEVNDEVDERYNVERSTEAACKYFKEAYSLLGSWSMVAGSYNMGIGGIRKQMEKQKVRSYYDLLLNDETFRYIFRILALKEIIAKPAQYGYHFKKTDLYGPYIYNAVVVDSSVSNLVDFAESYKINYKILKLLNPWLRQNSLSNKGRKPYVIKILKAGFTGISDGDDLMLVDTTKLVPVKIQPTAAAIESEKEEIEAPAKKEVVKPVVTEKKLTHKVKKGETLVGIAKKYKVSAKDIKTWNVLEDNKVQVGERLIIIKDSKE